MVQVDFSTGGFENPELFASDVKAQLRRLEADAGIEAQDDAPSLRLRHLVQELRRRSGERVVVLVDEYDKPILDALEVPEVARANRDFLRGLYATIKASDEDIRSVFRSVRVVAGSVEWPGGIDRSYDTLYLEGRSCTEKST